MGTHTSILDHIFSDMFHNTEEYEIIIHDIVFSDHRLLFTKFNLNFNKNTEKKESIKYNYENISNEINLMDYENITLKKFYERLITIVKNNTIKTTKRKINQYNKEWIDNELRTELNRRKELFEKKK